MNERFRRFAHYMSARMGSPGAFCLALASIALWAMTGPLFRFSDTWQLVMNTATSIMAFLMVFLIQSTQNRDSQALQLKLDELIRTSERARDRLIGLEKCTDEELAHLEQEFQRLRAANSARETA